jgi:hypothetical protein
MDPRFPRYPVSYSEHIQIWHGTPSNPYPMNFVQAPSYDHQKLIQYQGDTFLQGLSTIKGPMMYPVSGLRGFPTRDRVNKNSPVNFSRDPIRYPLDPYNASFYRLLQK